MINTCFFAHVQEQSLVEKFRSQGGAQLKEFCQFGTTDECMKTNGTNKPCDKLHFKKIIHKHTDGQFCKQLGV